MHTTTRKLQHLIVGLVFLLPTAALAAGVEVINISGAPGATVAVAVKLNGEAADLVAGTQNDIRFDPSLVSVAPVAANNNKPDCKVNSAINKKVDGSETFGFGFLKGSAACNPTSETCDAVRAIVVSTDNVDAIATGATLFTCNFKISASATVGQHIPLTVENAIGSDPAGQRLAGFAAQGGEITVATTTTCLGDCGGDPGVSIGELQIGLNIFFGAPVSSCPPFDPNNTGGVGIGQLQIALNNFFGGCGI